MTQKKQYILTDSLQYKIEGIFGINDQILLLNSQISTIKALIYLSNDVAPPTDKFQTCKHEKEDNENGSTNNTASQSQYSPSLTQYANSPSFLNFQSQCDKSPKMGVNHDQPMHEENKVNYTQIMLERWIKANQTLPDCDKQDFFRDTPLINGGIIKKEIRQHDPEFSQTSYLRLRSLEEAFPTKDYFHQDFDFKSCQSSLPHVKAHEMITQFDRSFAIQKIFDLHIKKDYKVETLFTACSIFDRYLTAIDWRTYHRNEVCRLAVISILMAAKIEQPISPSFQKMIYLLSDIEKENVNKENLIELENKIINKLNFNFMIPGPIQTMERYLRILEYDKKTSVVYSMAYQICKFSQNDSMFLEFRPSQLAAASCIISINIFERDQKSDSTFFEKKNGELLINTNIWNNPKVVRLTGYSILMIKEPIYQLANFIRENLTPDRLEGFNLEALNDVRDFQLENKQMVLTNN